jgi:hypothetical protein
LYWHASFQPLSTTLTIGNKAGNQAFIRRFPSAVGGDSVTAMARQRPEQDRVPVKIVRLTDTSVRKGEVPDTFVSVFLSGGGISPPEEGFVA